MNLTIGEPRYINSKYIPAGTIRDRRTGRIKGCAGVDPYCVVCVFKEWCDCQKERGYEK